MTIWNLENTSPDPRTITLGARDFLIDNKEVTQVVFEEIIFDKVYRKNFSATMPTSTLTVPAKATWQTRIEFEWRKDEFEKGIFDGYAEASVRVDDTQVWPYGLERGTTKPVFTEKNRGRSRARRLKTVIPSFLLFEGEDVSLHIQQFSKQPRILEYVVFSATLLEPAIAFKPSSRSFP